MHPWLIETPGWALPTYMTMLMVGATIATFVLARQIRRSGLPRRPLYDVALLALPGGFVGARLALLFERPWLYLQDPLRLLLDGGWVFYGAFLGGAAAVWLGARWRDLPGWATLDVFAPCLPMGMAFGRLGCLGAGCCHGRPADWPLGIEVPWAVRYFHAGHVPEVLLAVPLHPSPLYESFLALGLFVWTTRRYQAPHADGQVVLELVIGYGAGRFLLEFFRGDLERGFALGGWLSTAQVTALGTMLVAGWLLHRRRKACTPS